VVIDRTAQWVKATIHWIARAKALWVGLGIVLLVCILGSYIPRPWEDRLRYIGLVLELCGIFTVIFGLNDRLRQLSQPTLLGQVRAWLASAPPFPSKPDSGSTGRAVADSSALVLSEVAWGWDKTVDTSPQARLDALEKNVERLKESRDSTTQRIGEQERQWKAAIAAEQTEREKVIQGLWCTLQRLSVGGFQVEAIGLGWLSLGAALATIPKEIITFLEAIWEGILTLGATLATLSKEIITLLSAYLVY
jgi:hypothetical protein